MHKLLVLTIILLIPIVLLAQDGPGVPKGSRVFLRNASRNQHSLHTSGVLSDSLTAWGYWQLVKDSTDADFVMEIYADVAKGGKTPPWGSTAMSVAVVLTDKQGKEYWESDTFNASPTPSNGFNAGRGVVRKVIRNLRKHFHQ